MIGESRYVDSRTFDGCWSRLTGAATESFALINDVVQPSLTVDVRSEHAAIHARRGVRDLHRTDGLGVELGRPHPADDGIAVHLTHQILITKPVRWCVRDENVRVRRDKVPLLPDLRPPGLG